jgi:chemotaxis protein methyltransferase CheR
MVLLNALGHDRFEVIASDLNTDALAIAKEGRYPIEAARDIPWAFRSSFCIKGTGEYQGQFLMDVPVRERLRFEQINLHAPLPDIGLFDLIFLRNVIGAFPLDGRRTLVERVMRCLKPDGYLIIGESENLHGLPLAIKMVRPSVYMASP